MKILVTGSAGFIGLHIVQWLLRRDDDVTGLDNINNYYDVRLKYSRLNTSGIIEKEIQYNKMVSSRAHKNYRFIQLDLSDRENIQNLF